MLGPYNSLERLDGSCFNSVVRVVVKSSQSFIIVIAIKAVVVLLLCHICCLRVDVTERHNQYLRTIGQNLGHVRTQDCAAFSNIAIKQGHRNHSVDLNDDGTDDDGADALRAVVNEEQAKVYDPM